MIYVIRTRNTYPSFIKVGFTREKLMSRIKSIQTGCPFELELIKKMSGDVSDERRLHDALSEYKSTGEWFRDCAETMKILGIDRPRAIKVTNPKKGIQLNQVERMINKEFRPRDFYGHKKRLSFELFQFCEKNQIHPRYVMDFNHRRRAYEIKKISHKQAVLNHNFLGEYFEGISTVLVPKKGSRHIKRKQLEDNYCSPVEYFEAVK